MSQNLHDALGMFAFLAIELSILFLVVSFLVGLVQWKIPAEKIQSLLGHQRRRGYLIAAGLGAITPFCSCSTIPILKGLIKARAGFGPMMVFLFASPLLNPIIVVLLFATFGMQLTLVYVISAFIVSVSGGWLLNQIGFERYVRDTHYENSKVADFCCGSSAESASRGESATDTIDKGTGCCSAENQSDDCCDNKPVATTPFQRISKQAWSDFIDVLPYLLVGIVIGSVIYGFVPTDFLQHYAGSDNPFAIPLAAIIGVPLYIRAEAVIPLAYSLLAKGVGAGTVMALIIGSAGASLTELILLRSLFKTRLLVAFVAVVMTMAIAAGYLTYLLF